MIENYDKCNGNAYNVGDYCDEKQQFTLRWNDEKLNIHWPVKNPIISERDI